MISPDKIRAVAARKEDENLRFRTFLKNRADPEELDRQFMKLHQELFSEYDCRQCGNCCREYGTALQDAEIESIAAFLGIEKQAFIEQYMTEGMGGPELPAPCRFLEANGNCAIQDCKPTECSGFPYTDRPERIFSLYNTLSIAEICPVVFEMLELLKEMYRFRR